VIDLGMIAMAKNNSLVANMTKRRHIYDDALALRIICHDKPAMGNFVPRLWHLKAITDLH
jgi:hypothetical protein